ncbi:MAG: NAD(P)H-dependent oxidoreductase subunit E [Candidatus Methylopumilus sp.]|nr:NAD(P)H-dependent oxidoreductase subunit E [Candidatus Methylopumilus sp.]
MIHADDIKSINRELKKYPDNKKQSAVIAALRIIQSRHRWLSNTHISEVAHYLEMPEIAVMEVATFYNMFNLQPKGKYQITVCTNISCMLRNSDEIVHHLEKKLGISFGEITKDKKYSLKEGECMGACSGAPLCLVNNETMHEHLSTEKIDKLLVSLK